MNKKSLSILITGANSDIGSAVVSRVANDASSSLLITSHSTENETLLQSFPASVRHLQGIDLTETEDTQKVAAVAGQLFDKPFCWLHCAGEFWHHKTVEATPLEEVKRMISSHFITLYATAKAVIPVMKRVGGGRVLAFSCNSVRHSYPEMAAFTPAKAAVESFIKCLANEVIDSDILANCLALPTIRTKKVLAIKSAKYHPFYISVDDLVDTIVEFFATMSPLMTGNSIGVVKYSPYFYREGYFQRNRPKDG